MVLSEVIAMQKNFFMFIFLSSEAANLVSRIVGETTSTRRIDEQFSNPEYY